MTILRKKEGKERRERNRGIQVMSLLRDGLHFEAFIHIGNTVEPWMFDDLFDRDPSIHIPIKHLANKIKTIFRKQIWNADFVVHDLVDLSKSISAIGMSKINEGTNIVEWVLLVTDGV
jgi:hypothetical protein